MSSHRSDRRLSQYLFSQLDHHLLPVLLVIGVAGACSHTQATEAPPAHPAVAVEQPPRRPPPPPPPEPAAAPVENTKSSKELAVYFDFDSALLRDDARPVLQKVAAVAKNRALRIEGNCDEVGTVEYNLALGEHRAIQAKDYLTRLGIPAGRIKTVSYGSQHPKDPGHDDQAHAENRRDDFIVR
jgi:peptidoglycan-associated lipoprotein